MSFNVFDMLNHLPFAIDLVKTFPHLPGIAQFLMFYMWLHMKHLNSFCFY